MQPTLIIGLGGTGAQIVSSMSARLQEYPSAAEMVGDKLQYLYIDTDTRIADNLKLPEQSKQTIGFFALSYIEQACQQDENLKKWFDCHIVRSAHFMPEQYDLTRSKTIYRQFGRLCLYHDLAMENYSIVKGSIRQALQLLRQQTPIMPLVIICTSLIGGTGGAIALDIAYLIRRIFADLGMNHYECRIIGVFAMYNIFASALGSASEGHHDRYILNEVAAIKEILYFARTKYEFGPQGNIITFDNLEPFSSYWLYGGDKAERTEGIWPNYFFPLIAARILNVVLKGDLIINHQELKFAHINAPLTTSVINDWPFWEDVYNKNLKAPNRLSPHISFELCK